MTEFAAFKSDLNYESLTLADFYIQDVTLIQAQDFTADNTLVTFNIPDLTQFDEIDLVSETAKETKTDAVYNFTLPVAAINPVARFFSGSGTFNRHIAFWTPDTSTPGNYKIASRRTRIDGVSDSLISPAFSSESTSPALVDFLRVENDHTDSLYFSDKVGNHKSTINFNSTSTTNWLRNTDQVAFLPNGNPDLLLGATQIRTLQYASQGNELGFPIRVNGHGVNKIRASSTNIAWKVIGNNPASRYCAICTDPNSILPRVIVMFNDQVRAASISTVKTFNINTMPLLFNLPGSNRHIDRCWSTEQKLYWLESPSPSFDTTFSSLDVVSYEYSTTTITNHGTISNIAPTSNRDVGRLPGTRAFIFAGTMSGGNCFDTNTDTFRPISDFLVLNTQAPVNLGLDILPITGLFRRDDRDINELQVTVRTSNPTQLVDHTDSNPSFALILLKRTI